MGIFGEVVLEGVDVLVIDALEDLGLERASCVSTKVVYLFVARCQMRRASWAAKVPVFLGGSGSSSGSSGSCHSVLLLMALYEAIGRTSPRCPSFVLGKGTAIAFTLSLSWKRRREV